jgi:hypothetical protein
MRQQPFRTQAIAEAETAARLTRKPGGGDMAELSLEDGLDVLDRRSRRVRQIVYAYLVATLAYCAVLAGDVAGILDLETEDPGGLELVGVAVAFVYAVIFIASVVIIARWIYRAHANVRASGGQNLDVTPGWAVGWFFVPIANLFKPFQAMRELWNASHLEHDYFVQESPALLKLWWGFWIVGNLISNLSLRFAFSDAEKAGAVGSMLDLAGCVLLLVSAWFLLRAVQAINTAQRSTLSAAATFG